MNTIYYTHELNPYYAHAVTEHNKLHAAGEAIERLLGDKPDRANIAGRLIEARLRMIALRDVLARHFAQEEEGGYLEEAMATSPKWASQAAALKRQHAELLEHADRVIAETNHANEAPEAWEKLKANYAQLAKQLRLHEKMENSLLQRAFNEDLGLEP